MSYLAQIKDYVEGFYDGPHATPKESDHGPIFLGIKNVTLDGRLDFSQIRHVSPEEYPRWTKRVTPQKDDIVFSYEATLHRYALIPDGFIGCLGRRMALIRPDKNKVNPRFLHYYMLSSKWRKEAESSVISGATVDRIPLTKVPNFKVDIPPINQQEIIVEILSSYDDLIENNKRRFELLEESARQLYKEWFVRFRFPGHEHVKNIDGVPEGWKKKPLREVLVLNYGKALKAETRISGNIPVYGSSGEVGKHNKALVKGPGIVVGRKGNVGSIFWVHSDFFPIDTVYFISAEQSDYFIYYALLHTTFINTDVAVPGLNRDMAYSREVLLPKESLRKEFVDEVAPIFEQYNILLNYNNKLSYTRDLLLPKLMSGEVVV